MTESVLNNISIFDEKNRQNLPVLFLPAEKTRQKFASVGKSGILNA